MPAYCSSIAAGNSDESMKMALFDDHAPVAGLKELKLTVVYDNVSYASGMSTDLGFACLVEGLGQTLLFDSGRLGATFLSNLSKLGLYRQRIDAAFLSHEHRDHVGGMPRLLQTQPPMAVYLPASFSSAYKKRIRQKGAQVVDITQPALIGAKAASTGEMRSRVKNEHSLVVRTDKGAIAITGCAHPGILDIVHRARNLAQQEILLVMGGFHLRDHSAKSIRNIVDGFQQAGVRCVAPSHCTGGLAVNLFAETYGSRFIRSGAGRVIRGDDIDRHGRAA